MPRKRRTFGPERSGDPEPSPETESERSGDPAEIEDENEET